MNKNPKVSVITVVYNGERFIEETIKSVLNQTYNNIEYIIIDGGSTDGTIDIIKRYENRIDYWVSESDNGIYDAWNKGIKIAKGEWISFLGADDFYLNDAITNYINLIITSPKDNIMYISSKNILCDENKNEIKIIGQKWNWNKFKVYMNVAHVGSLHNRKLYKTYGFYDTEFKICADYEFLLRVGKNLITEFLDEKTCFMRNGGISNIDNTVFLETFNAKKKYHTRNIVLLYYDLIIALMKYKLRNIFYGY